ncbi:hypothetical protein Rsub_11287 [Raphidocelis subcapitata]|uniref:Uncharacterized protein n=1 Tax=Raphidocelis subcapitata TaxID=307507 RepID=A0A2V0PFV9_9CHLO|nr:hypothetical protein Rsub_11287 [Raphidocelis subcapitata]|eukprot:GBF98738.1 hypothetical protein Rsub_11287 [Raphidocelis subcapitata]
MASDEGATSGKSPREGRGDPGLNALVSRLQQELSLKQRQLKEEIARNTRAKAQVELVNAIALAGEAVRQLLAAEARGDDLESPEPQSAVDALERQLHALKHAFDRGGNPAAGGAASTSTGTSASASADASAGACPSSSGGTAPSFGGGSDLSEAYSSTAPPAPGAPSRRPIGGPQRLTAGTMLRAMLALRHAERSRGEFIESWRGTVQELAMGMHRGGGRATQRFEELLHAGGVRFCAMFLFDDFALDLMVTDLETQRVCDASAAHWDRVAAGMQLSSDQVVMYGVFDRWWTATTETLQRKRRELAAAALAAPQDLEAQEAAASGLERVNSTYLVAAVSAFVVGTVALLRPEQVAECWVCSWPRLPLMTAILRALTKVNAL